MTKYDLIGRCASNPREVASHANTAPLVGAQCHGGLPQQEGIHHADHHTHPAQPEIPLPPGYVADDWEAGHILSKDETRAWRMIYRPDRTVTDHDACVAVRAVQYSDGSLDDDIEIIVHGASCDDALNSDQPASSPR
jgi:hypothetical protein